MNTKHYLVISGIIGGVIGSLLTALLVSPVTAQRDKFRHIECRTLSVVDAEGKTLVYLASDSLGGRVYINSTKRIAPDLNIGFPNVELGVDDHGGKIEVYDHNQMPAPKLTLSIDNDDGGGRIAVYGKNTIAGLKQFPFNRGARVILDIDEHGGRVVVDGKDGESNVLLLIDEEGGNVAAYGKDGKSAGLNMTEIGGYVAAYGKDGQTAASLGVTEHGGRIQVKGKSEGAAVIGINEYGNGAVSTWDKNGYRQ